MNANENFEYFDVYKRHDILNTTLSIIKIAYVIARVWSDIISIKLSRLREIQCQQCRHSQRH